MSILDDAQRLAAAGRQREAVALVAAAAEDGDAEALFAVANWRLFGLHGPRDVQEAHRLLDAARAQGHVEAIRTKAILLGNGTGCIADAREAARLLSGIADVDPVAASQLGFSESMADTAGFPRGGGETLSERPLIRTIRALLTPEECRYLIALAEPALQPSFVINPVTGRRMPHPTRTSLGMSFGPTTEDRVVRTINERLARVSDTDIACGEPLHILRYTAGQEYKPHLDTYPGEVNQRDWTVLVYLNGGYAGGGTRFDAIGLEFVGREGDALIYRNVDGQGAADPLTRHAGLPIIEGVKWLATRWIRRRPHDPWSA